MRRFAHYVDEAIPLGGTKCVCRDAASNLHPKELEQHTHTHKKKKKKRRDKEVLVI
ncbi:hypothetical protein QG37_04797 [Candidozyma auris]|uniref:Uncharacterized protein n=1 Tax=Candidozyma auris TaxID=498019 RepID=A0A0L0NWQ4_CANAR|nr:hypothetical protein QG37_04797 [[Candida] auris]